MLWIFIPLIALSAAITFFLVRRVGAGGDDVNKEVSDNASAENKELKPSPEEHERVQSMWEVSQEKRS